MAEAIAMTGTKNKVDVNKVTIHGRISLVKQHDNGFITEITMPAPDEFSRPETIPVSTKRKIGNVGDIIDTLPCRITGFVRSFPLKNGEQGRDYKVMFRPVDEQ